MENYHVFSKRYKTLGSTYDITFQFEPGPALYKKLQYTLQKTKLTSY